MKKIIVILVTLLILSNLWWLYVVFNQAVTQSYGDQRVYELDETRKQMMNIIPSLSSELSKKEIVNIISKSAQTDVFEKGGCIWVDWIGLKFDKSGKLDAVVSSGSYDEETSCD